MKNNPLDDIIKCDVEISSPASNDVSFDSILMIVPEPSDGDKKKTMSKVTAISSADELLDYGYKATDEVYVAATVAFAQNPAPNELLICIRKKTDEDDQYEDMAVTLARANAESNFYGIHITSFRDKADVAATVSWTEANESCSDLSIRTTQTVRLAILRIIVALASFLAELMAILEISLQKTNTLRWP